MRCRHCGKHIVSVWTGHMSIGGPTPREWVHSDTGNVECIIAGADVGTRADPKDNDTWEEEDT